MEQNYSVLMSVYEKEKPEYFKAAIESMLNQTSPANDFVLVCDGPLTKELDSVIETMCTKYPEQFQIVRLKKNCGLGNALNAGLEVCKNELVARMDSDDISCLYRCELQLKKFRENPELALCSGNIAEFITDINKTESIRRVPVEYKEILTFAKKRNPMNHMAVMFKKSAVETVGGYIEISYAEDYYLWVRMLKEGYKAANIDQVLVKARIGNGMYERRGGIAYAKSICGLQKKMLDMHFISHIEFFCGCLLRISASLLPARIRRQIYQKKLRGHI